MVVAVEGSAFCTELLRELVAIPSESGEEEIARYTGDFLRRLGGAPRISEVEPGSFNVVARFAGNRKGPKLLLGGHLDTVSPNDRWESDPFVLTEKGPRLHGLGAVDMKGGLAAQLTALNFLLSSGGNFAGEIVFAALADEERYSAGANFFVEEWLESRESPPDFAILGEPHFAEIVTGATGKALLSLSFAGESGHAARPESGVNAIDSAARFLVALNDRYDRLYREGKRASCCALRMQSKYEGYSLNIPDRCEIMLNKQLSVDEDIDMFMDEIRAIFSENNIPGKMSVSKLRPYYPSYCLGDDRWLSALTDHLGREYGASPALKINESVSDANVLYPALGVPTVLFGPDGGNLHKENEFVNKESLATYVRMLSSFIAEQLVFME